MKIEINDEEAGIIASSLTVKAADLDKVMANLLKKSLEAPAELVAKKLNVINNLKERITDSFNS